MRLLPGIRSLAQATFGHPSLADMGVEMDYTVYPVHARVFRLRPSWQYQKVKYEVTDYKRLGARAKAGKDDVFLVKAKVPSSSPKPIGRLRYRRLTVERP